MTSFLMVFIIENFFNYHSFSQLLSLQNFSQDLGRLRRFRYKKDIEMKQLNHDKLVFNYFSKALE